MEHHRGTKFKRVKVVVSIKMCQGGRNNLTMANPTQQEEKKHTYRVLCRLQLHVDMQVELVGLQVIKRTLWRVV